MCWCVLACAALGGCYSPWQGRTELVARSLAGEAVQLSIRDIPAVYSQSRRGDPSLFLSDIPVQELGAGTSRNGLYLHIDVLWMPKPGATPMDAAATNAAIRLVIVASGEIGVYGGGGFVMPQGRAGAEDFGVKLRRSSLTLLEATEGFNDLLTPAEITGTLHATLDEPASRLLHYTASQFVTNALGQSRFVNARSENGPWLQWHGHPRP